MKRVNHCMKMCLFLAVLFVAACSKTEPYDSGDAVALSELEILASYLSDAVDDPEVLAEVHGAVCESAGNGYDEEYLFENVFSRPGCGTGSAATKVTGEGALARRLFMTLSGESGFPGIPSTRSDAPSGYLQELSDSDLQIYWPYSSQWDGVSEPVVTFDDGRGRGWNYGYVLRRDAQGKKVLTRVLVDEEYSRVHPVWVVNCNSDKDYMPVRYVPDESLAVDKTPGTRVGETIYTLMLRGFTATRNYDCWLAGASEYFIKVGAIENFTASTEAEMALFNPTVTDFYLVVRRGEVGIKKEVNTILVSDWTTQMSSIALMIIEDDGGKQTSWETELMVKVNSKSYGVTISIPLNTKDEIVWRGSLSSRYLFATDVSHTVFNDVILDLEIVETYNNSDW